MRIFGISALYHDSSAAIVVDGNMIAAAQEDRFGRKKHDPGSARNAIEYCLKEARRDLNDLDAVNVRGEPIVCTPSDAFRCFMESQIETLIVGNCFLQKEDQNPGLKLDYESAFDLD